MKRRRVSLKKKLPVRIIAIQYKNEINILPNKGMG
jgi:hypothetical protein